MDVQLILLDIPPGVVTFASAIFAALVLVIVTFGVWVLRLLFSIQGRLTVLETKLAPLDTDRVMDTNARMAILWEHHLIRVANLVAVRPPENPMKQERWDELTNKLVEQKLSDDEAEEFLAALLKREEQARQEKDVSTLAILDHGIVLTKWQLKEKELREQR